jgi:GAF domain-containing protein
MPEPLLTELIAVADASVVALEPAGHELLLQSVVDAARELFGAAACSLALIDDATDELVYRVASGAGAAEVVGLRLALGRGIGGWVVASGMPIAVDDLANDARFGRDVAEQTGFIPRSILATPLQTDEAILGVLSVLDRVVPDDAVAAQREVTLLGLFAAQAALAIDAARVYRDLSRNLLAALRQATNDEQLVELLDRVSEGAAPPDKAIMNLAALFARLGRADPDLLRVAGGLVEDLVTYAQGRADL